MNKTIKIIKKILIIESNVYKTMIFIALNLFVLGINIINAATPLLPSFNQTRISIGQEKDGLEIDLNKISLNLTNSSLSNQALYTNYSDSNLKGNSQLTLQFFHTFNVNYYSRRFVNFNSMIMEYGFTEITYTNNRVLKNKSLDKILFSTDYTQRTWDFDLGVEYFEVGPFFKLSYQTEFNPTPAVGRRHIISYIFGAKLFDGKYIKNLYFDIFGEHDLNVGTFFNGFGFECGFLVDYKISKDIKWSLSMNAKKYLVDSKESKIFPDYQFLVESKLQANLFKSLSISPTLRYYILKARNIDIPGSNLMLGVSLNFGKILLPAQKPLNKYEFLN